MHWQIMTPSGKENTMAMVDRLCHSFTRHFKLYPKIQQIFLWFLANHNEEREKKEMNAESTRIPSKKQSM